MAIIVQMPSPRPRSAEAAAIEASATILFFTGVRYVREIEDESEDGLDAADLGMMITAELEPIVAAI